MIILGIDPGYAIVGYGIIEKIGNNLKPIDYGVITTHKDLSTPDRLQIIYKSLQSLIKTYNIDAVAVEELFFNKNVTTAIAVAQARGIILLCAKDHCGKLFEYTPMQIKLALTGYGKADKKQMQFMVKNTLNLASIPTPDDAADALAVAICHSQTNQNLVNNEI